MLGAGLTHRNIRGGKRATAWTAFVLPVLGNPLLTVLTCALVTRVFLDSSGRAVGVEMSGDGVISRLRAGGDVILFGGVIGSAQLMLLSGIRAAEDLRTLDIPVQADLPGVGANLHDHILTTVVWESRRPAGDVDFSGERWTGVLSPLNDPAYFAEVTVDPETGTIVWPDGIDLAPEPLYEQAKAHPLLAA